MEASVPDPATERSSERGQSQRVSRLLHVGRPRGAVAHAGFFSRAQNLLLPIGEQAEAGRLRGYHIDLRVKADSPQWPPAWYVGEEAVLYMVITQWGLGCYERYLAGEGGRWLAGAVAAGEHLVEHQQSRGPRVGGWLMRWSMAYTYHLSAPWLSGMAQGQGASLLVRLYRETGQDRFADAARLALLPLSVPAVEGGAGAQLGGRLLPEEYPTSPPSLVLNGAIFGLWGTHDVAVGLGDTGLLREFEASVDNLVEHLHRWDTGAWSRYDLHPHPVVNVASSFYHALHINQMLALDRVAPRSELTAMAERFAAYAQSARCRRQAFARKVAFRLLVPRSPTLARCLPWRPKPGA